MADIQLSNAPFINKGFYVTGAFGESRGSSVHRGLDLAPEGFAGTLYAIDNFTIQYVGFDESGYGHYFIANNGNGMMYLYAHLSNIAVSVGDTVPIHGYVGESGQSGSATGVHLHLEMQAGTTWQYRAPLSTYTNPCDYLIGIINEVSVSNRYIYNDSPTPPVPPTNRNNHHFPWYIYSNNNFD